MKSKPLLLLSLLAAAPVQAQQAKPPALSSFASNAAGFAPRGWTVEREARGDLNRDGLPDFAFVLIAAKPDPNPRMLGVALGKAGGGYTLAALNSAFLPAKRRPNGLSEGWMLFEEDSIAIAKNQLHIRFEYTRGHRSFTFGWRAGTLQLTGFDSVAVGGGCLDQLSINFLTRRAKMSAGWIDAPDPKPVWRTLPPRPLLSLQALGDGEELDPYGLITSFPLRCPERP
ncbi:MAG TPA: hypothetical protein VF655_11440 [Allosphingosinicella sp.]|jgi:hypothetical protein